MTHFIIFQCTCTYIDSCIKFRIVFKLRDVDFMMVACVGYNKMGKSLHIGILQLHTQQYQQNVYVVSAGILTLHRQLDFIHRANIC